MPASLLFLQMTKLKPLIKTNNRPQNKRNDVQVLRFVAIAAVLGFHLRPQFVPQGYLGVDIFFVISGYLMTLITASSKGVISLPIFIRFYERRLKRLCPTYILTLFTTIVAGKVILIATEFELFRSDSIWALVFGLNIQSMLAQEDYFQLISEYKFLLHTWSLSVEVQFYLAAPFILALIARSGHPLTTCGFISAFSLAFQAFVPSPTWAFGCVLSRIWQFLFGTAVFYMEKRRLETESDNPIKSNLKVICGAILLVTLLFIPELSVNNLIKFAIRVLATALTGILMYYAPTVDEEQILQPLIRVMALLGDASYSIYLAHWPMIVFAQYLDIFDSTNLNTQLTCILLVAFIQYYLFERRIASYETKTIFTICGVLYFLVVAILFSSNTETPQMSAALDVSIMDPVMGNQLITKNCHSKHLECPHVPELSAVVPNSTYLQSYFCGFRGHGKRTLLVTGNSFALFQLDAVKKALKGKYKTLYVAARPVCLAFDALNRETNPYHKCDELVGLTVKILKTLKPDVMMIIQRIDDQVNFVSGKAGNTTIVKYLENELADYSQYTKKIFVVEPNKLFAYPVAQKIAKTLQNGQPIENISVTKHEHHRIHKTWQIMLDATKSCPKCEPLWVREHLCNTEICPLYDEKTKLALYCDSNHMSPLGVDKIVPAFRGALKRAFQEISSV